MLRRWRRGGRRGAGSRAAASPPAGVGGGGRGAGWWQQAQLALELESKEEGRRSAAAALMVRLLCSPEAEVADHYPDLTKVALQRFKDVAAPIRLQMLDAATRLMADAIPPVQEQVQALATERLSDPDERVRCAALRIVCELGQRPEVSMTRASLNAVAGRLKDVKLSVRKEAASGCMTLFRTAAGLLAKGGLPDELDVSVLAYPARLAAAALSDPELRSHVFVLLHSPGLVPLNTPPAAAARVWAGVWAECEATGRDALLRLLRCKAELAGEVARLLGHTRRLRAASKAPEPDEQQLASFKRRQAR
ncbi:sister chromatid cohesion protein PDS5, partial [Haematococcus lacustris]